jgi:hypothetical protein
LTNLPIVAILVAQIGNPLSRLSTHSVLYLLISDSLDKCCLEHLAENGMNDAVHCKPVLTGLADVRVSLGFNRNERRLIHHFGIGQASGDNGTAVEGTKLRVDSN